MLPGLTRTHFLFCLILAAGIVRADDYKIRIGLPAGTTRFETKIQGPENEFLAGKPPLEVPLVIDLDRDRQRVRLDIDGHFSMARRLPSLPGPSFLLGIFRRENVELLNRRGLSE